MKQSSKIQIKLKMEMNVRPFLKCIYWIDIKEVCICVFIFNTDIQ